MTAQATAVDAHRLELQLLAPQRLVRLFSRDGGHWREPPPPFRNLRVDPPAGHKAAFAVLYTADTLACVAQECNVLKIEPGRAAWSEDEAERYRVARYSFETPAVFLPIDGRNRELLGLGPSQRQPGSYASFQEAALALHRRFGKVVHGLSWDSFHRDQNGRVYALWHDHKATIGLAPVGPAARFEDFPRLIDDAEWKSFIASYPGLLSYRSHIDDDG